MATDLFDLHIKISRTNTGTYSAKTILGANAVLLERFNTDLTVAVRDLMTDMEHFGAWRILEAAPSLSMWPFGGPPAAVSTPTSKPANATKKKQVPQTLERPVDLSTVNFPDCEPRCQAHDLFGSKKCKALCQSKKGV